MSSQRSTTEQVRAAFSSSLLSHFRDSASRADLQVDDTHLSAVWEQGLLVAAASVAEPKASESGDRDLGLIHISTPKDTPLVTDEAVEFPPGDYVLRLANDESASLTEVGGRTSIPLGTRPSTSARDDNGGGRYRCSTILDIEIKRSGGKVCISLVCRGKWVVLLGCFAEKKVW